MSTGRIVAGIAIVAALAVSACGTSSPTFAEADLADVPPPRDTTEWIIPGAAI